MMTTGLYFPNLSTKKPYKNVNKHVELSISSFLNRESVLYLPVIGGAINVVNGRAR